jgi:hypothetical protein
MRPMPRYFFDICENNQIATDELGIELPSLRAAEIEAAQSLADMAKDTPPTADRPDLEIAVRTKDGPLFKVAFTYQPTGSVCI